MRDDCTATVQVSAKATKSQAIKDVSRYALSIPHTSYRPLAIFARIGPIVYVPTCLSETTGSGCGCHSWYRVAPPFHPDTTRPLPQPDCTLTFSAVRRHGSENGGRSTDQVTHLSLIFESTWRTEGDGSRDRALLRKYDNGDADR